MIKFSLSDPWCYAATGDRFIDCFHQIHRPVSHGGNGMQLTMDGFHCPRWRQTAWPSTPLYTDEEIDTEKPTAL